MFTSIGDNNRANLWAPALPAAEAACPAGF
jgi:hypothetical protein